MSCYRDTGKNREVLDVVQATSKSRNRHTKEKSPYNGDEKTRTFKEGMINRMEKDGGFMKGIIYMLGVQPREWGGIV